MIAVSQAAPKWPRSPKWLNLCGPHQMQVVLASRGIERAVQDLYMSKFHERADYTLPIDMKILLSRHGIRSRLRFWLRSSFIKNVIACLKRDEPVVFVVKSIQGTGSLHWLSIWGYDPESGQFFCYDSQCATEHGGHGNVVYHAPTLLKGLPWRGTFALSISK